MKKVLLVLVCLLALTACGSNHYSSVSDGTEVIYKDAEGNSFTKADLYETMKNNDVTDLLKINLIKKLANYEGIDMEEISNSVEEQTNSMIDAGYETFITSYYGTVDNYKKSYIANEALTRLIKAEVEANFETYKEDYNPYKAQIVKFDTKEAAQAVIDAVKDSENTFEYACTENGYTEEITEKVYSDKSNDLPAEVKEYVLNAKENGLSGVIEVTTAINDSEGNSSVNNTYYLVNLTSKNVEDFRDEFVTLVSENIDKDTIINKLLEKYNLEVHDQRIYELLKAQYEAVK